MHNVCSIPAHVQQHGQLLGHAQLLILFSHGEDTTFEIYKYQQGRVILRLQDQRTLGSLTFQYKGVGFGVETMKYEKFWEISKFHAGGDDKQ